MNLYGYEFQRESDLSHYGVLGMHWGIRRFQPYSVRGRESGKGGKEVGEARAHRKNYKTIVKEVKKSKTEPSKIPPVGESIQKRINETVEKNKQVIIDFKKASDDKDQFYSKFCNDESLIKKHLEYAYFYDGVPLEEALYGKDSNKFNFDKDLPKMLKREEFINCAFENYINGRHPLSDAKADEAQKTYKKLNSRYERAVDKRIDLNKKLVESLLGKYADKPISRSNHYSHVFNDTAKQIVWANINLAIAEQLKNR